MRSGFIMNWLSRIYSKDLKKAISAKILASLPRQQKATGYARRAPLSRKMPGQMMSILGNTIRNDNEFSPSWNPEEYLKFRKGKFVFGFFKRWFETRAIENCLKGLDDIHSVCDIPCGPGTLFPHWHKKGYKVIAADLSGPMTEAAEKMSKHLDLEGRVIKGEPIA